MRARPTQLRITTNEQLTFATTSATVISTTGKSKTAAEFSGSIEFAGKRNTAAFNLISPGEYPVMNAAARP